MSNGFQAVPGGRGKACPGLFLLAGLVLVGPRMVPAHDTLGACVQHGVHLAIGAQHIDLTIELTFFEDWSARERRVMDADGNGTITRDEQEAYLKRIAPRLAEQVNLQVAGRELPLVPLYEPEIDLLANNKVGLAHHRIRVFFFVTTPADLRAGDEFVVEDRLWPDAKPLAAPPQAEGRDGCELIAVRSGDALFAPAQGNQPRLVKFKCLALLAPKSSNSHPNAK